MKKIENEVLKDFLRGLPSILIGTGFVYWVTERFDLAIIAGVLLLAGVINNAFGTYLVWRKKKK